MQDTKNGKQYLPQTYEQFLQQKKKAAKGHLNPRLTLDPDFVMHESKHEKKTIKK